MPAAAWAAKSGDAVLFTARDAPPARDPAGDPPHTSSRHLRARTASRDLGTVERQLAAPRPGEAHPGRTPVANAIAFARYSDGDFGWGVRDPGHGLVFANVDRTQDAAAAARARRRSGKYGPLLLLATPARSRRPLENYLLDIQPGYRFDPGARCLQPRLDPGRRVCDRPRGPGPDRRAGRDRARARRGLGRGSSVERSRATRPAFPGPPRDRR